MKTDNPMNNIPLLSRNRGFALLIFILIVAVGVGSRFWLLEWPNFKPVAALCLFAGFLFSRYLFAIAAGVCILMISDWQLGGYQWQLALTVYASMAVACGLGWWIKNRMEGRVEAGLNARQFGWFAIASLTMSTAFFLSTNAAVWGFCEWYGPGIAGLIECYTAALPFYRWTLMGDLTFTVWIVGCYQTVCVLAGSRQRGQFADNSQIM